MPGNPFRTQSDSPPAHAKLSDSTERRKVKKVQFVSPPQSPDQPFGDENWLHEDLRPSVKSPPSFKVDIKALLRAGDDASDQAIMEQQVAATMAQQRLQDTRSRSGGPPVNPFANSLDNIDVMSVAASGPKMDVDAFARMLMTGESDDRTAVTRHDDLDPPASSTEDDVSGVEQPITKSKKDEIKSTTTRRTAPPPPTPPATRRQATAKAPDANPPSRSTSGQAPRPEPNEANTHGTKAPRPPPRGTNISDTASKAASGAGPPPPPPRRRNDAKRSSITSVRRTSYTEQDTTRAVLDDLDALQREVDALRSKVG